MDPSAPSATSAAPKRYDCRSWAGVNNAVVQLTSHRGRDREAPRASVDHACEQVLLQCPVQAAFLSPLDLVYLASCCSPYYAVTNLDERLEERVRAAGRYRLWLVVWHLVDDLALRVGPDHAGAPRAARLLWFLAARQASALATLVQRILALGGVAAGSAMLEQAEDDLLVERYPLLASHRPHLRHHARTTVALHERMEPFAGGLANGFPANDIDLWIPIARDTTREELRPCPNLARAKPFEIAGAYAAELGCHLSWTVTPGEYVRPFATAPPRIHTSDLSANAYLRVNHDHTPYNDLNERNRAWRRLRDMPVDAAFAASTSLPPAEGHLWLRNVYTGRIHRTRGPFRHRRTRRLTRWTPTPAGGSSVMLPPSRAQDQPYGMQLAAAALVQSLAPAPQFILTSNAKPGSSYRYVSGDKSAGCQPNWLAWKPRPVTARDPVLHCAGLSGLREVVEPLRGADVCNQFDLTICQHWAAVASTSTRIRVASSPAAAADLARHAMRLTPWALTWRFPAEAERTRARRAKVMQLQLRRIAKYRIRGYALRPAASTQP